MDQHPKPRILIADDEPLYLRTTGDLLRKSGFDCECVHDAHTALARLDDESFDLLLSDLNMPGNLKLELLRVQGSRQPNMPIIVVTGVPTLPSAIESIRLGIMDYLLKPVKFDDMLRSVRRALDQASRRPASPPRTQRSSLVLNTLFPGIIGNSPSMLQLFEVMDRIASTDANILITGESGTGKEVVANAIHQHSHRKQGKFQVIDCTSVPEALFESLLFGHKRGSFTGAIGDTEGLLRQCDGGTAFFDELGELPLPLQAKLLRAVQEQTFIPVGSHTPVTVNTRFICATNRLLEMEVAAGRFRQDLFYRLSVVHIELPPLRERGEDVITLAEIFLKKLSPPGSTVQEFADDAIEALMHYAWPGNIRELRNVIERTVALVDRPTIVAADLPPKIVLQSRLTDSTAAMLPSNPPREIPSLKSRIEFAEFASREAAMEAAEFQYLVNLLQQYSGNVSEAAQQARLSRQGLHKLLKKHAIRASDFRR